MPKPLAHAGVLPEGVGLTGAGRLAGVMGAPVAHSLSPVIHNHWLRMAGLDGAYIPLHVEPDALAEALRLLPDLGFQGFNLTLPLKETVLPLLDQVSERAQRIGAVNTLIKSGDGTLHGDNTDALGFAAGVKAAQPNWQPDAHPALVLGAGGAARAILAALPDLGVSSAILANRNRARADSLAAAASDFGLSTEVVDWDKRALVLGRAGLVINTTSLGMTGQPALDLDLAAAPETSVVCDIVYTPLETPLLKAARQRGLATVDGLWMLLYQAVPGFKAWFGVEPDVTQDLRSLVLATLKARTA